MGRARAKWIAAQHPRGPDGRFIKKATSNAAPTDRPAKSNTKRGLRSAAAAKLARPKRPRSAQLHDASDEQLADLFAAISAQNPIDEDALNRVVAEMDRRERPNDRVQVSAEQAQLDQRIDRLVAEGWEFRDAYAEAHGLSSDELLRQERRAAVDANRRAGETREHAVRRLYAEWVHLQYLKAERTTRGHLLTRKAQARGIDPVSLFSGPSARARKWASEDLKRWWADTARVTYTEFRADMLGRPGDIAEAERIRKRANDKDFGL